MYEALLFFLPVQTRYGLARLNHVVSSIICLDLPANYFALEKIAYPLLYFNIPQQGVLGMLVGTDLQMMDKDLEQVKRKLGNYLQRRYKKYDDYPFVDITQANLRIIEFLVRPTYRDEHGSYPLSESLSVPLAVVFGPTEQENYVCRVPALGGSFYYHDPKQLDSLVHYFVTNALNQLTPARIYELLRYERPRLDEVILKINAKRNYSRSGLGYPREYPILRRLTERFPLPRNKRTQRGLLPDAAWELENAVAETMDKLIHTHSNVLLVGPPGVGKSAVLQQAIRKITNRSRRQKLEVTFWRTMSQRLTTSTRYLGEWEEQIEKLIAELQSANGILWVVDVAQLLQTGGKGAEDSVAAFLLPYLEGHQLQLVGEVSPEQLDSMRRLLPAFVQNFQLIWLEELPPEKIRAVFDQFAQYILSNQQIEITPAALDLSYQLLHRYYPYESFPGKGIKFLGRCVNHALLHSVTRLTRRVVVDEFVKQTGLPELFLRDDLLLDQKQLEEYFANRIIGQPAAIQRMLEVVKIYKAGINNPHKPIATLLFAGPTGVGKTASAKALADYFFGQGQKKSPLIRIDMSEFQHASQIHRLIGSGTEVGQLVKEVRERPFAVILLDEVEKAASSIFDALLTVLDEGLLVDGFGRVTNFRNTIIIMTSNLGASQRPAIGYQDTGQDATAYHAAIAKHFRPEFINRIDGIVSFNQLDMEDMRTITQKELRQLAQREGFIKRRLQLTYDKRLVDHLVTTGTDRRYGARPLQRAIEQHVVKPISYWLLENPQTADVAVHLDWAGKLVIEPRA